MDLKEDFFEELSGRSSKSEVDDTRKVIREKSGGIPSKHWRIKSTAIAHHCSDSGIGRDRWIEIEGSILKAKVQNSLWRLNVGSDDEV